MSSEPLVASCMCYLVPRVSVLTNLLISIGTERNERIETANKYCNIKNTSHK